MPSRIRLYALLALAVANISTASVLVRLSGVHGFVAATWRLVLATILTGLLLLIARDFKGLKQLNQRDLYLMILSGIFLSLHFGLWMMSLSHLSVAVSVTIVDSYPALMAIIGVVVFGERYSIVHLAGAGIAMSGVALLSLHSAQADIAPPGGDPLFGALLSFLGMICVALYFAIGKGMRTRYSTLQYTLLVYAAASVSAILISKSLSLSLTGYSLKVYGYLILLALLPMLGGHTIINHVLKELSLLAATIPILGEPIGAGILAWILLGEHIDLVSAILMGLTLLGIGLTLLPEKEQ